MSKTKNTIFLEKLLTNKFNSRSEFYVFECTIGWGGKEIVDCIMYNHERMTHCYEIKQSKQDFYSKSSKTFIGNKNYYVMPYDLYLQVKKDIPYQIGCYVSVKDTTPKTNDINEWNDYNYKAQNGVYENGFDKLICIKKADKIELKADKEVILSSMLRTMQAKGLNNYKYFEMEKVI